MCIIILKKIVKFAFILQVFYYKRNDLIFKKGKKEILVMQDKWLLYHYFHSKDADFDGPKVNLSKVKH